MLTNEFKAEYDKSTSASVLVMKYLETNHSKKIVDLTYDKEAQARGVDFSVDSEDVEFKIDSKMHMTGNLAFEIVSNAERENIGCGLHSKAKWLLYMESETGLVHKIYLPGLIQAIKFSEKSVWKIAKCHTTGINGKVLYFGFSLLVPLSFIKQAKETQYQSFQLPNYAN